MNFNQILQIDKDHQVFFVGGPEHVYSKSKMADGRHLGNTQTAISPSLLDRFAPNLAIYHTNCSKTAQF